jgi:hypothetical protein
MVESKSLEAIIMLDFEVSPTPRRVVHVHAVARPLPRAQGARPRRRPCTAQSRVQSAAGSPDAKSCERY